MTMASDWYSFLEETEALSTESRDRLLQFIKAVNLAKTTFEEQEFLDELERLRRKHLKRTGSPAGRTLKAECAALNVLADLIRQGFTFREFRGSLQMQDLQTADREARRLQLLAQRREHLRSESVQEFVRSMERRRFFGTKRVSIFSLMRDGRELADALRYPTSTDNDLEATIQPYLEFVEPDRRCEFTGLYLMDIWRYFRLTWTNRPKSIPGRTIMYLVRDRSAENHPVMGIGALGSSAVKVRKRDECLGWEPDVVVQELTEHPTTRTMSWLEKTVDERIAEIFIQDLIEDEILQARDLEEPGNELILALRKESEEQREIHRQAIGSSGYSKANDREKGEDQYWETRARSPLFRSKRAGELASLLQIKEVIRERPSSVSAKERLRLLLDTKEGSGAVRKVVRLARSLRVGTAIADLVVCGAVPPYNPLLVGKLVAMLSASPEMVREYRRRYEKRPSVIASSMAGRRVVRPADLVFIGTTSLYGERPSQYDRISIPGELLGGEADQPIKYRLIADTEGWGTSQFGDATTRAIQEFLQSESNGGRRVNFLFGEGANPKLRALREGLSALGFDEESLLRHGNKKSLYGVRLISNLQEYLLGQHKSPRYLFDRRNPAAKSERIAEWWRERWLRKRLQKTRPLEEVRDNTLIYPIRHRARVLLPPDAGAQERLFE